MLPRGIVPVTNIHAKRVVKLLTTQLAACRSRRLLQVRTRRRWSYVPVSRVQGIIWPATSVAPAPSTAAAKRADLILCGMAMVLALRKLPRKPPHSPQVPAVARPPRPARGSVRSRPRRRLCRKLVQSRSLEFCSPLLADTMPRATSAAVLAGAVVLATVAAQPAPAPPAALQLQFTTPTCGGTNPSSACTGCAALRVPVLRAVAIEHAADRAAARTTAFSPLQTA
jgi:hypothetical protein